MITIKYKCDETGQEMDVRITIPEIPKDPCNIKINFTPEAKEKMKDPYGIMRVIYDTCTGGAP